MLTQPNTYPYISSKTWAIVNSAFPYLFLGRSYGKRTETKTQTEKQVTVEEVNRLLEVGRLLFSVLTPEEINELQNLFSPRNQLGIAGDS
jgi:hypothetical protein